MHSSGNNSKYILYGYGITVILLGNGDGDASSNLDEAIGFSLRPNNLGKGVIPYSIPSTNNG